MTQQLILLLLGEGPAFGNIGEPRDDCLVLIVFPLLLGAERDEMVAVGALGEFCLHVGLAAAEHVGLDAFVELVEVAVTSGTATVVQIVVFAVEAEERPQQRRVEEVHQRIQLVNAVLDGRPGEDEGVTTPQPFNGLSGLGAPVLDALSFVQHDNVGLEALVDLQGVGEHLLVIDDGEERLRGRGACPATPGRVVGLQPLHPRAEDELVRQFGELLDLLLPLGLQGGRGDDQHARGLAEPVEQSAGGNGLDSLAQAHLVGQQCAFGEGEVKHAFALVGKERDLGFVRRPFAAVHLQLVIAPELCAFRGVAPRFEPGRQFLGQAQRGQRAGGKLPERLDCLFGRTLVERAVRTEPSPQDGGEPAIGVQQSD